MRRRSSAVPPDIPVDPFGKRRPAAFRERTHRRHATGTQAREHGLAGVYAPDQPWALMGISLRIPARAAVGIVGVNGSGKLENGKITGSGTYDGLLKSSAVFRRMTGVR
jgi:hypothetical protein